MAASRQTYIHTTSANAVTLVWGSLRLAPINSTGGQGFMAIVNKPRPQVTPSVLIYLLP